MLVSRRKLLPFIPHLLLDGQWIFFEFMTPEVFLHQHLCVFLAFPADRLMETLLLLS